MKKVLSIATMAFFLWGLAPIPAQSQDDSLKTKKEVKKNTKEKGKKGKKEEVKKIKKTKKK